MWPRFHAALCSTRRVLGCLRRPGVRFSCGGRRSGARCAAGSGSDRSSSGGPAILHPIGRAVDGIVVAVLENRYLQLPWRSVSALNQPAMMSPSSREPLNALHMQCRATDSAKKRFFISTSEPFQGIVDRLENRCSIAATPRSDLGFIWLVDTILGNP